MIRNVKLVLAYDGTNYQGWQIQPNGRTVQGTIEDVLRRISQEAVRVVGSGRTDAGAHALEQVAHFHTNSRLDAATLLRGLNGLLPSDIRIDEVADVPLSFHARYSAKSKTYRYLVWNHPVLSPFYCRYAWHVARRLDIGAMQQAASALVGTNDFSAFRASSCTARHGVRTVLSCTVSREDGLIEVSVEANAFLHRMVRIIVGTLAEVGIGKRASANVAEVLRSCDRSQAGPTAAAHGLYLKKVFY